jgi:hypothetical protein
MFLCSFELQPVLYLLAFISIRFAFEKQEAGIWLKCRNVQLATQDRGYVTPLASRFKPWVVRRVPDR